MFLLRLTTAKTPSLYALTANESKYQSIRLDPLGDRTCLSGSQGRTDRSDRPYCAAKRNQKPAPGALRAFIRPQPGVGKPREATALQPRSLSPLAPGGTLPQTHRQLTSSADPRHAALTEHPVAQALFPSARNTEKRGRCKGHGAGARSQSRAGARRRARRPSAPRRSLPTPQRRAHLHGLSCGPSRRSRQRPTAAAPQPPFPARPRRGAASRLEARKTAPQPSPRGPRLPSRPLPAAAAAPSGVSAAAGVPGVRRGRGEAGRGAEPGTGRRCGSLPTGSPPAPGAGSLPAPGPPPAPGSPPVPPPAPCPPPVRAPRRPPALLRPRAPRLSPRRSPAHPRCGLPADPPPAPGSLSPFPSAHSDHSKVLSQRITQSPSASC
ncbi:translation initiation factor IF-2-like [Ochotona curzoniae]|uniref:translation initiation factor IF-2-like n=1 Tax=Ochotona curzoniae TaxID=130825 RepID=UPI001B34C74E|nr:translation initiation factor IF-2-like [Ochotona curzoniae]